MPRSRRPAAGRLLTLLAALTLLAGAGCAPKRVLRDPAPAAPSPAPQTPPAAREDPAGRPGAPGPDDGPPAGDAAELGLQAAGIAHAQLGRPYRWGGEGPAGFDCSGLVFYAYGRVGVAVPRVVREQARAGREVPPSRLRAGDLVFFATRGSRPDHVGIYLGDDRFVHAPRAQRPVRLDSLQDPWWRERWLGARRVAGAW
jgi:cell wall-associated NlpC family hydrolase